MNSENYKAQVYIILGIIKIYPSLIQQSLDFIIFSQNIMNKQIIYNDRNAYLVMERQQRLARHKQKIKQIEQKSPQKIFLTPIRLRSNTQEDKRDIIKNNNILINKLVKIMERKITLQEPILQRQNNTRQLYDQVKVQEDNMRLLSRINAQTPTFSTRALQISFEKNLNLSKSLNRYMVKSGKVVPKNLFFNLKTLPDYGYQEQYKSLSILNYEKMDYQIERNLYLQSDTLNYRTKQYN
ncbi:hypothetical protein pb186bvf_010306 [Paramecium bursaria]